MADTNDTRKTSAFLKSKGCAAPDCLNPHHAKGYCAMHWERVKRTGEPGDNTPKIVRHTSDHCSVDGCDSPPHAHGMCGMHRNRMKRYGSVDFAQRSFSKDYFESCFDRHGSGCWLWKLSIVDTGYAHFCGKLAHRVSYRFYKGEIPSGMLVMHSCDTRHCVNPAHLSLGTHQMNMDDMIAKKRHWTVSPPTGTDNPQSKFSADDVVEIRRLFDGGLSMRKIAKKFAVHHKTISTHIGRADTSPMATAEASHPSPH